MIRTKDDFMDFLMTGTAARTLRRRRRVSVPFVVISTPSQTYQTFNIFSRRGWRLVLTQTCKYVRPYV